MKAFRDKKILVVGGAGFVGSNLVVSLLDASPHEIVVVDNLLSAERANVPADPRVSLVEGSITDDGILERLRDEYHYVFHLATFHGNQNSIHDPMADHDNNTLTTLKLYERLKAFHGIAKIVYSSAGCTVAAKTFDKADATTEDDPVSLHLDSPYQISKIVGEFYSNYYFSRHRLPIVKARFQNVYGPREILGAGRWRGTPATVWRNVIPAFIYRAIRGLPLPVENEGIATRDFIFVDDIVRGLMLCAVAGQAGAVYNLASGREVSILDLAKLINEATDNTTPVEFLPGRTWDRSGKRYGSTEKARRELGFEATVNLKTGIGKTIEWTLRNQSAIEDCMRKHIPYLPDLRTIVR